MSIRILYGSFCLLESSLCLFSENLKKGALNVEAMNPVLANGIPKGTSHCVIKGGLTLRFLRELYVASFRIRSTVSQQLWHNEASSLVHMP